MEQFRLNGRQVNHYEFTQVWTRRYASLFGYCVALLSVWTGFVIGMVVL